MTEQEKTYTKSEIIALIEKVLNDQISENRKKITFFIEENQKLEQSYDLNDINECMNIVEKVTHNNQIIERNYSHIWENGTVLLSLKHIIENDQVNEVLNK